MAKKKIKVSVKYLPIKTLIPYKRNNKTHTDQNNQPTQKSIATHDFRTPIEVDKDMVIIAGHGRVKAALKLGMKTLPVIIHADLTKVQAAAYRIASNKSADQAEYNFPNLADEILDLDEKNQNLEALGMMPEEIAQMMNWTPDGEGQEDDFEAEGEAEKIKEPESKRGEIYQLGSHRLMCGDATSKEDVEKLMDGKKADIALTDPPYGIGLDYSEFNDSIGSVAEMAKKWLPIAREISGVVVFTSGVTRQWLYPEPEWVMCWFYGGGQFRSPWGFNCWQPVLCYGKDPSLASKNGCRPDAVNLNTPANLKEIDHPCPKPMALWDWLIKRLSFKKSDVFYDPFGGSGSTLIACEQLKRTCYMMEIDPVYCDVIRKRYEGYAKQ